MDRGSLGPLQGWVMVASFGFLACSAKEREFEEPSEVRALGEAGTGAASLDDAGTAIRDTGAGGATGQAGAAGTAVGGTGGVGGAGGTGGVDSEPVVEEPQVPVLEVEPASLDLGGVTRGFAARGSVRVGNAGNAPLPVPTVSLAASSHADFEIVQNQCLSEVEPGASCEIRVEVVPSGVGALEATLEIASENAGSLSVPVTAEGLAPGDLVLAPSIGSFEDFGGVLLGARAEGTFTVSNPGATRSGPLSLSLNRADFAVAEPAAGECVTGVTDLASGEACNVRIALSPAERGALEATLTVTSELSGSVSLTLTGTGLSPGVLSASLDAIDFGGVVLGESGRAALAFENVGDEPLTVSGLRLEPAEATEFSVENSTCGPGTQLVGGGLCEVELEFRPTAFGQEFGAELVANVEGGASLSVPLAGRGLEPGSLVVVASAASDFGSVLLNESATLTFEVTNPGVQPSGVLTLSATEGFSIVAPAASDDCVPDVTSLVDGESCRLRVRFEPVVRQDYDGSLTIGSALAGAASLPIRGRGITPARFEVDAELDFGRVLTGAQSQQQLTIRNGGDQVLPPPEIELTGASSAERAAFAFDSNCVRALAFGEACTVGLTFAPTNAVPHSVNLRLSSDPGGTVAVLLRGEALAPGSLVLAVAEGQSADYGDVEVNARVTRTFTLSNPGNVASGRLTIRTDDNRFEPDEGDCNAPADGLVDGSSCTFQVTFTPDSAVLATTNLSVESPGAGRAGLELRGRGRSSANLVATGQRDLGRANIGQPSGIGNEFLWTVNNEGDLPTGELRVDRNPGNPDEFQISGNTCNASQIEGRSSCQMTLRFVPAEPPGNREETIVVTDTSSNRSVSLVLTGVAVRLAGPGESCVNAICAEGVCTRGVCCNRQCDRTCELCSPQGQCLVQSNQEACGGDGAAACFGVDQCLLPAGQACGSTNDCGGDLSCKSCTFGGSQCTAPQACCGSCPGSLQCVNGACGCPAGERACGQDQCIATNQAGVCCPSDNSPSCPADSPVCRPDSICVECLDDAHCSGDCRVCGNNDSCTNAPESTACSQGVCTATGACVECVSDAQCDSDEFCDTDDSACRERCIPSAEVCDGNDNDCNGLIDDDDGAEGAVCQHAVQVVAGIDHTCARFANGGVRCWGSGFLGQLGGGVQAIVGNGIGLDVAEASNVDFGMQVAASQLAAGNKHTCALLVGGGVRCWGFGLRGQLGYGNTAFVGDGIGLDVDEVGNVDFGAGITATQIAAGAASDHTCALLSTGGVRCWGEGFSGRLGYGNNDSVGNGIGPSVADAGDVDLRISGAVEHVSVGINHTCALLSTGGVRCWGRGDAGQLGYGNTDSVGDGIGPSVAQAGNVDLGAGVTATQISAGLGHTCALLSGGGVRCWGTGISGMLGYGNTDNVGDGIGPSVAQVGNVNFGAGVTATQISAGVNYTCALLSTGGVRCWGNGFLGRLGYGNTDSVGDGVGPSVAEVGDIDLGAGVTATQVATGYLHACAVLSTGGVRCWGSGHVGNLGYGNTDNVGDGTGLSVAEVGDVQF